MYKTFADEMRLTRSSDRNETSKQNHKKDDSFNTRNKVNTTERHRQQKQNLLAWNLSEKTIKNENEKTYITNKDKKTTSRFMFFLFQLKR